MAKLWWDEETWTADDVDVLGTHEHATDFPVAEFQATAMGPDRAKLAAAAPEMARLLLALEWAGNIGQGGYGCAECSGEARHKKHYPDCALLAVLRKAGVLT